MNDDQQERIDFLEKYNAMLQEHIDATDWWTFFWMGIAIVAVLSHPIWTWIRC